jgi:hypothetical protein
LITDLDIQVFLQRQFMESRVWGLGKLAFEIIMKSIDWKWEMIIFIIECIIKKVIINKIIFLLIYFIIIYDNKKYFKKKNK